VCGQIHVDVVQTSSIAEMIDLISTDGFTTQVFAEGHTQHLHCRRDGYDVVVQLVADKRSQDQTFVTVPYPPYSLRPWKWRLEGSLFDTLTSKVDRFSAVSNHDS
jgi:hypothetical protein